MGRLPKDDDLELSRLNFSRVISQNPCGSAAEGRRFRVESTKLFDDDLELSPVNLLPMDLLMVDMLYIFLRGLSLNFSGVHPVNRCPHPCFGVKILSSFKLLVQLIHSDPKT